MATWLLNLVRRKPLVKLLSLLSATILWFFVMQDQNPIMDTAFTVPLAIANAPERCKITPEFKDVQVKLRGPRSVFAAGGRDELKARLDLEGLGEGRHHLRVQTAAPSGMEILSVLPDSMEVVVDAYIQRKMPINLIQTGTPADGVALGGMTPESATVTVVGPHSLVDRVDQVIGNVALGSDHNVDFNLEVPLQLVDSNGLRVEEVRCVPQVMAVYVQLARGLSRKVVDIRPLFEGVVADGYAVTQAKAEPVRIEIAGEAATLARIAALDTAPVVVAGLDHSVRRTVSLNLPEGVTVSNRMVVVSVEVEKKP